jgi:bisphosphoglycerate-dependent phosphoglycerate mutase
MFFNDVCPIYAVCLHYEVKAILGDASVNIFFQNVRLLCCSHNNSLRATIVVIDGVHILRLQICVAVPVIAEF